MSSLTRSSGSAPGLPGALSALALLSPSDLPAAARARHGRRALEQAAEHGAALLQALGLPRIVTPDFEPVDPSEVGAALDAVIAALDEADAPAEDLEDEGDDEPSLGWPERVAQPPVSDGGSRDLELDTADWEHTLGAPERHPFALTMTAWCFEPADGQGVRRYPRDGSQAMWAQGARQDGEGEAEPGYDLPEGDDERCASGEVDAEPSLGALDHPDQTGWGTHGTGGGYDRELDPTEAPEPWTPQQLTERARGRRIGVELRARADAIRHRRRPGPLPIGPTSNVRLIAVRVLNAIAPNLSWRLV